MTNPDDFLPSLQQPLVDQFLSLIYPNGVDIHFVPITVCRCQRCLQAPLSIIVHMAHICFNWTAEDTNYLLALWYLLNCPHIIFYIDIHTVFRFPEYVFTPLWNFIHASPAANFCHLIYSPSPHRLVTTNQFWPFP
ncbi:hypothetical protein Syun_028374 [Stephania yunnanensis]|uniref:Uncharacterized protein n=1 Tax=Stephania yunnanensis TaxID=152371 RepID=A0AAP0HLV2_9MAGN